MPSYTFIRRFEDGREESSDFFADFGSGIRVGALLPFDDGEWMIVEIVRGDPVTLIAERQ